MNKKEKYSKEALLKTYESLSATAQKALQDLNADFDILRYQIENFDDDSGDKSSSE